MVVLFWPCRVSSEALRFFSIFKADLAKDVKNNIMEAVEGGLGRPTIGYTDGSNLI